jgi:two-component system, cell cycle sensor histidine kinase and response regulator CckA
LKNLDADKFKVLVENVQDLIFLFRLIPNPHFEYVSPSSININGYSPEEHYEDPDLFFKLVPEDDYPLLEFIRENPRMIKKPIIMRWKKKDGKIIWTEQRYFNIFDNDGELIAIEGFVRNITEEKETEFALRESEKKFRELFHHINDLIFLFRMGDDISKKDNLIEFNDAASRTLGYSREDIFMMSPFSLIPKKDISKLYDVVENLKQKMQVFFEIELMSKDGKQIPFDVNAHFFRLDGEDVVIAIARDITERKKLEKEILKTQKLESISILAGGIAHDFNNILSAILGNISLAKLKAKADRDLVEILSDSEKASFRAKNLTNQLLTFSQGGTPIKKTARIEDLIKNTAIFVLRGSNVNYKFFFPDDLWLVDVDTDQISQVINNLVINARQAMPDGGIVELSAKNISPSIEDFLPLKDKNYVKITVKDTGVGIPKENLHRIFDPFFSTKKDGSGLGLASTYSILKKHDGYITVESEIGKGAVFHVYLPASDEKNISEKGGDHKKILKRKGKILIMDDDKDVRHVAGKLISQLGYKVDFANDGVEAIALYKKAKKSKEPFDLIIMDLTIPGGMGGKETIEILTKMDPELTAIVSSGYHNDPIVANYKKYGFKGFINKPYTIEDLNDTLCSILEKK